MDLKSRLQFKKPDLVKQARWICMVAATLFLVAGICMIIWRDMNLTAVRWVVCSCFAIVGIARIFGYFSNDLYRLAFQFDFAFGLFAIMISLWIVVNSDQTESYLQIVTGIYVLLDGLQKTQIGLDAKRFGLRRWWTMLASGIVALLACIPLLFPVAPTVPKLLFVGVAWILNAILNGWNTMAMTVRVKNRIKMDEKDAPSFLPDDNNNENY